MNDKLIERLRDNDLLPADMEFLIEEAADALEAQQARIEKLEAVRDAGQQFMMEVAHAMQNGPSWYTRGESGLRDQIYLWIDKMRKALAACKDGE